MLVMNNEPITKPLFIGILLILILNAAISTGNLIQDGAILRRIIPTASWSIAVIGWIVFYIKEKKG